MFFVFLCILVALLFLYHYYQRQKDPPGPVGWPIFGSALERIYWYLMGIKYSQNKYYSDTKDKYGALWSRKLFNKREIVFASQELVYESLLNKASEFSNRPEGLAILDYASKMGGILFVGGRYWKVHRKDTLKIMQKLGINNMDVNDKIVQESERLLEEISKCINKPVESDKLYSKLLMNVICQLVINKSFEYDDQKFNDVIRNVKVMAEDGNVNFLFYFRPILDFWIFKEAFKPVRTFMENMEQLEKWVEAQHNEVSGNFNAESDTPLCILEHYLVLQKQQEGNKMLSDIYSKHQIIRCCFDIYTAGLDTTTYMLCWCTLMLGLRTDFQKKIRNEIKENKSNLTMNFDTTKSFHFFKAFLDECLRNFPVISRMPRSVVKPLNYRGYHLVPTDIIQIDLIAIGKDPNIWENPNEFDPFRFMDDTKQFYKSNKHLIPFGIGKRSCIGENLARKELTIVLLNIIERFEIKLTQHTLENINSIISGTEGFVYAPLAHEIIYTPI